MELEALTRPELIFPELAGTDPASTLRAFSANLAEAGAIQDAALVYQKLLEREELGSTGIGSGVAIPHCKVEHLDEVLISIGVTREPIEFGASDGLPVRLFFVVLSPEKAPAAHLKSLAAISRWVQTDSHVERILERPDRSTILELIREPASESTGVT